MSSAPAVTDGVHTVRTGGLPSWLRIALVLLLAGRRSDSWGHLLGTAASLRAHLAETVGLSPLAYRRRFRQGA